jgi:outer membrane protein assembly factor BamA
MRKLLFIFLLIYAANGVCSTERKGLSLPADTTYQPRNDFNISAFPLVFYLPETSLAFGGVGIMVFNSGKEKAWRKSQIQLGLAYTLKNQFLLFVPYELYFKQQWKLNGELGFYRYFYNYYGIGVHSKMENLETYDATFPRLITNLSYRVTSNVLLGVQYRFDQFNIPRIDSLLSVEQPIGSSDGGRISSIGFTASYDSRDDIFYPRKGFFATLTAENSGNYTGGSFNYSLVQLDVNYYFTLGDQHTIATNFYTGLSSGDLPFFAYYYLSSGKKGRGFNDRRFIDRQMELLQIEYRFPIYKRFRGAAFASSGTVSPTPLDLFRTKQQLSYGAGLRFQLNKKQMSHIRADIARSREGFQFYVTIGEAF